MAPPNTVLSNTLFTQSLPILSLGSYIEVKEGLYQPISLSGNTNGVTGVDLVVAGNTLATESNNSSSARSTAKARIPLSNNAVATGLRNTGSSIIRTNNAPSFISGVAVAQVKIELDAKANSSSLENSRAIAKAAAIANISTTGIDNRSGVIRTGDGADQITGIAIAQVEVILSAAASAQAESDNPSARAKARSIAAAQITGAVTGLNNNSGNISTGRGNDKVLGVGIVDGVILAQSNSQASVQSSSVTVVDGYATSFTKVSLQTVGINNIQGRLETGSGSDEIIGISAYDFIGAATSTLSTTTSAPDKTQTNTFNPAVSLDSSSAVGINNRDGIINTGDDNDIVRGYGVSTGITGGTILTGNGDDYVIAAKIDLYDPLTGEVQFSANQTGAIENTNIFLGSGNDIVELGGFGRNVMLHNEAGADTLKLWGSISDYKISVFRSGSRPSTFIFEQAGNAMTVQGFSQFSFGNTSSTTFTAAELAQRVTV